MKMATQQQQVFSEGENIPLEKRTLYTLGGENFVFQNSTLSGSVKYISMPEDDEVLNYDVLMFNVSNRDKKTEQLVPVFGTKGSLGESGTVVFGRDTIEISYGALYRTLPFSLYLKDFILKRYAGSSSPESFRSEVVLIDLEKKIKEPRSIFMNTILEHRGYRFYQSSYDNDERGTILSVNYDFWGSTITYGGYFLLFLSGMLLLFTRNSYFSSLKKKLSVIQEKKKKYVAIALLLSLFSFKGSAQENPHKKLSETFEKIPQETIERFEKTYCQSPDGRIIPISTLAHRVLRKVFKKDEYQGMSASEVLLGMTSNPFYWQQEEMIKVSDKKIKEILNLNGKHAKYSSFFLEGKYVLLPFVEKAYKKKPSERNVFDKDIISVDERVNIAHLVYRGDFLRVFPVPKDENQTWISPFQLNEFRFPSEDSVFVQKVFFAIFQQIQRGDYEEANVFIEGVQSFQKKYGSEIIPPKWKSELEIFYNELNIFQRIYSKYLLLGLLLLVIFFLRTFSQKIKAVLLEKLLSWGIIFLFLFHTLGLIARWVISEHEPWSNGYESMIYIGWGTMMAGIFLSRKNILTKSVAAIMTGIILFVAHLSWMDPEITTLEPVLSSYWLTIHVATITLSYGFFGLGFLLGVVTMILRLFMTKKRRERLILTIQEITVLSEMTLTVGLIQLIIGNFLGGIWANESWGRYWGWDPKETWAMVTIIVYAFILHMRLIPKLKSDFAFNFMSIWGFTSVIMTYFGVNYYLSGLHSYAKGDPPPLPDMLSYSILIIFALCVFATIREGIIEERVKKKT